MRWLPTVHFRVIGRLSLAVYALTALCHGYQPSLLYEIVMPIRIRLPKTLFLLCSLVVSGLTPWTVSAATAVDPALVFAIEEIWEGQAPATSLLSKNYRTRKQGDTLVHEPDVRNGISFVSQGAAATRVDYLRRNFKATDSPWGGFPHLDATHAELTKIDIPRRNYLILSAPGEGLFSIGDWSRLSFLHVLDVTRRNQPVHYPLVAEAGLGTRALGRLPGSSTLNYARLVPSRWQAGQQPTAYEVTLYALESRGPRKVIRNGRPLTYLLSQQGSSWSLAPASATPVTDERDARERPFTSRPSPLAATPVATASQQGQ